MNFRELDLIRPILKAVEEQGYTKPSPIQEQAIPPVLAGSDLLGCAQTGTGKTAAFALPILQQLAASHTTHKGVRALILTPTRELALQIDECFASYGKYLTLTHAVIFGGVNQNPQVAALQRGVDVLTACPGRLNDLIGQGFINLKNLEIFVLDEADRMLDMGFVNDVKRVIRQLPSQRQNLLFSATMPKEIEKLAGTILRHPVSVKVDPPASTVDRIDQSLYFVSKNDKKQLLAQLLAQPGVKNALVFSRTKHGANGIATFLNKKGVPAAAIHGNKSQRARVAALESFKAGQLKALIATDIAARGIDISELTHVFQLDLPEVPETYVHRIGRTGRAGAEGTAIAFCSPEEQEYLQGIEKLIRKKIPVQKLPTLVDEPLPRTLPATPEAAPAKLFSKKLGAERSAPRVALKPQPKPQREETDVEDNKNLSASAKRRRRRRRAATNPGEGQPQAAAPAQQKAEKRPEPAPRRPAAPAQQRPARPEPRQEARPAPRRGPAPAPVKKQAAPALAPKNEDPGLPLISPKAPTQKFTSFEDYMNSRGGPGAPIEETEE